MSDALDQLRELQAQDLPIHGGRSLAYVFDSGLEAVQQVGAQAVAAYAGSNGLDPSAFPSMLTMENELVGFACDLVEAPPEAVGTVTSGGTESIMLAVQGARDARPDIKTPNMILPATAHASFFKAANYFKVELRVISVDDHFRAQVGPMAQAMDDNTVLVVASAPSYAHGVIDPIAWLGAAAASRGVPLHVDACIGGWVLAYADRIGRVKPSWNFAVPGVSSISVDLHKYGYTPKGASILLHRDPAGRRPTYFASAAWPGYTMINTTMQSTKSGGPLAGAWATVRTVGHEGYAELARDCLDAVDLLVAGIEKIDGLSLAVKPDSTLIALVADETCDVFTIADEMVERGWYVQPQMAWRQTPPTLHLSVSAATLPLVDECLETLSTAVDVARETGPATVDSQVLAILQSLVPEHLTDDDFDALLEAAGLTTEAQAASPTSTPASETVLPGSRLPTRMAPINVLLNRAAPRLREAILAAYLDRLFRPVRTARPGPR
ncbi:aminotransferase class V-fold PLP-dependent enzyme [Nocardioides salsibiostraticola]